MLTNINIEEITYRHPIENKNWMVIYSKSRREKKVAQYCSIANLKYYLPLEHRLKVYGRKKIATTQPLFPGYLFCLAEEKEERSVWK